MTTKALIEKANDLNSCGCPKEPHAYGSNGWHFILATADHCWQNGKAKLQRQGNEEIIACNCTRMSPDGETFQEPPKCYYEGQPMAYELCEAYWKAKGRRVDPTNRSRLLGKGKASREDLANL